jgi:trehalose 6-phosphate synthase/phosphatase
MAFEQGTPDRVPSDQPDPVMVGPGLSTLGEGAYRKASTVTPIGNPELQPKPQSWGDGPSYFSTDPGIEDSIAKSSSTSSEEDKNANFGVDLLRHLKLPIGGYLSPVTPLVDPRTTYPGLQLTGRIISAAFCIPYKVAFRPGSDWVRHIRSHTSPY